MIISHKYKFIFIKTHKTASTSLEIALSKFCGEKDIITKIEPKDELIRNRLNYLGPQNYKIPYNYYSYSDWLSLLTLKGSKEYKNHMKASDIKSYISSDVWSNYFKFCFERNPYDKIISLKYYIEDKYNEKYKIDEFMKIYGHFAKDYYLYTGKNREIIIDKIYQYSDMQNALKDISKKLNLPERLCINKIRAKSGIRKKHVDYKSLFSNEDREYVFQSFNEEIQLFGYKF